MAEIAMRSKPVRRRPDNRVIGAAATAAAGLVVNSLIFATNGLVEQDSRSQGGSGGGAPPYVSFAAPHQG